MLFQFGGERRRDGVAERGVWPLGVVVIDPAREDQTGLIDCEEQRLYRAAIVSMTSLKAFTLTRQSRFRSYACAQVQQWRMVPVRKSVGRWPARRIVHRHDLPLPANLLQNAGRNADPFGDLSRLGLDPVVVAFRRQREPPLEAD